MRITSCWPLSFSLPQPRNRFVIHDRHRRCSRQNYLTAMRLVYRTMRTLIIYSSTLLLFFSAFGSALEVAPNSRCASLCIDDTANGNVTDRTSSGTYWKDIDSCYDKRFAEDAVGKKFAECKSYKLPPYKFAWFADTGTLQAMVVCRRADIKVQFQVGRKRTSPGLCVGHSNASRTKRLHHL